MAWKSLFLACLAEPPSGFQSKKPITIDQWTCHVTNDEIGFLNNNNRTRLQFNKALFMVDGKIPAPSC